MPREIFSFYKKKKDRKSFITRVRDRPLTYRSMENVDRGQRGSDGAPPRAHEPQNPPKIDGNPPPHHSHPTTPRGIYFWRGSTSGGIYVHRDMSMGFFYIIRTKTGNHFIQTRNRFRQQMKADTTCCQAETASCLFAFFTLRAFPPARIHTAYCAHDYWNESSCA
jgi:hypothetical protein